MVPSERLGFLPPDLARQLNGLCIQIVKASVRVDQFHTVAAPHVVELGGQPRDVVLEENAEETLLPMVNRRCLRGSPLELLEDVCGRLECHHAPLNLVLDAGTVAGLAARSLEEGSYALWHCHDVTSRHRQPHQVHKACGVHGYHVRIEQNHTIVLDHAERQDFVVVHWPVALREWIRDCFVSRAPPAALFHYCDLGRSEPKAQCQHVHTVPKSHLPKRTPQCACATFEVACDEGGNSPFWRAVLNDSVHVRTLQASWVAPQPGWCIFHNCMPQLRPCRLLQPRLDGDWHVFHMLPVRHQRQHRQEEQCTVDARKSMHVAPATARHD
mmetsp:Transcript_132689/g.369950  ORF Transcript_132689/g.369950 Transcript_132689/m.369950 type:complete len:327 (-) Transcript_132689:56-1036(-)